MRSGTSSLPSATPGWLPLAALHPDITHPPTKRLTPHWSQCQSDRRRRPSLWNGHKTKHTSVGKMRADSCASGSQLVDNTASTPFGENLQEADQATHELNRLANEGASRPAPATWLASGVRVCFGSIQADGVCMHRVRPQDDDAAYMQVLAELDALCSTLVAQRPRYGHSSD